jgi:ATP-dependent helicase/nuclease subunit A
LFELLPAVEPGDRTLAAARILATGDDAADPEEARRLAAEVGKVIDDPSLGGVFCPDALTEVEIAGDVVGLGAFLGAIDRLIVTPGRILAVDYKTNVIVPGTPEQVPDGLLRQMGAYEAMLERVYPGRIVEMAILWTAVPRLMTLPSQLTRSALARVTAG